MLFTFCFLGLKHGKGFWKDAKGNSYEGEYIEDKKHGWGLEKYFNGEVYEGGFAYHKKDGEGIYTYTEDSKIKCY